MKKNAMKIYFATSTDFDFANLNKRECLLSETAFNDTVCGKVKADNRIQVWHELKARTRGEKPVNKWAVFVGQYTPVFSGCESVFSAMEKAKDTKGRETAREYIFRTFEESEVVAFLEGLRRYELQNTDIEVSFVLEGLQSATPTTPKNETVEGVA